MIDFRRQDALWDDFQVQKHSLTLISEVKYDPLGRIWGGKFAWGWISEGTVPFGMNFGCKNTDGHGFRM